MSSLSKKIRLDASLHLFNEPEALADDTAANRLAPQAQVAVQKRHSTFPVTWACLEGEAKIQIPASLLF